MSTSEHGGRRALALALALACAPLDLASATTAPAALTVVAKITASPGNESKLLAALRDGERQTIAKEPGCLSFEVLTRDGHPEQFVLYESYRDEAAFGVHKGEPDFAAFEAAVKRFGASAPVIKLFKPAV